MQSVPIVAVVLHVTSVQRPRANAGTPALSHRRLESNETHRWRPAQARRQFGRRRLWLRPVLGCAGDRRRCCWPRRCRAVSRPRLIRRRPIRSQRSSPRWPTPTRSCRSWALPSRPSRKPSTRRSSSVQDARDAAATAQQEVEASQQGIADANNAITAGAEAVRHLRRGDVRQRTLRLVSDRVRPGRHRRTPPPPGRRSRPARTR